MIKEVEEDYKEKPIFLIGNKCEKNNKRPREISKEIVEDFALKNNLFYFEVSAKRIKTLQKTFYIMMKIADDKLTEKKNLSEIKIKDYEYDDDSELIDDLFEELENKNQKIKSLEFEVNIKNNENLELQKKISELKIKTHIIMKRKK